MPESMQERERFARLEAILDALFDLPESRREAWLARACAGDPALEQEAREMWRAVQGSEGFLEQAAPPPAAPDCSGWQLGPWRLQRCIGRGGMGEVWLAQRNDGRFEQQVAVKLLRHGDRDDVQRFVREQRLLSRLEHPAIARLLDAGSAPDGRPYMVMEYVDGLPLNEHCDRRRLDVAARIALFGQVCDAVAAAHRRAIVHRDLKPANILVTADGQVKLLDFGIARLLGAGPADTRTRGLQLTPQYAAPEQLSGDEQTTLTDVYALGLVLYELLAGQLPWAGLQGNAPLAVLQRALAGPPPPPSSRAAPPMLARRLRGDLDAIVLKALRPEPEARYGSVEALRDDLQRHLALRPVQARGDAFGYRLRRGLRRYWLAASAAALVLAGLLGALAVVSHAQRVAERERDVAQTEAARSKAVRDYLAHMFRDASQARGGAPLTARAVLEQAAERVNSGFASDPVTAAEVLKALGELNFYIDDYAAAEPLFRRWLEREQEIGDPVAAADVRFTLAESLHRMGRSAEAGDLLAAAQAFWQADPERHADVLLTSRMLQSQLQRAAGDAAQAVATLEQALPLRLQRSGEHHFETAVLHNNLGAAYIQAGQVEQGIEALQRAMKSWAVLRLEGGNDALNTLNNLAAAQFRLGELEQAEASFAAAVALRRELHGPSAATAALIGNHARVLQRLGRVEVALPLAEEAEQMALAHAGGSSPLTISVRLTRAELLLALGRRAEAAQLLVLLDTEAGSLPAALQERRDALAEAVGEPGAATAG